MARTPVSFISHGSPMYALEPGPAGAALRAWAAAIDDRHETPAAVVMMSPHWQTQGLEIMGSPSPDTLHDFGGFPPALYTLSYPAPGSPATAAHVQGLLRQQGVTARINETRPFDHGAWVPMMHLWPEANVPMVQLSLPYDATPKALMAIGFALQTLRTRGVMVIGSGSMTHNLRHVFDPASAPEDLGYVRGFADWVLDKIEASDTDSLIDFERLAPHAALAHPTTEHFLPLFFALGAVTAGERATVLTREVYLDVLAMDAIAWAGG